MGKRKEKWSLSQWVAYGNKVKHVESLIHELVTDLNGVTPLALADRINRVGDALSRCKSALEDYMLQHGDCDNGLSSDTGENVLPLTQVFYGPVIEVGETSDECVPTFEVTAVGGPFKQPPNQDGTPNPDACFLLFLCPKCGKQNKHGGVYGHKGGGNGHRSSHCRCWPNGYMIREV